MSSERMINSRRGNAVGNAVKQCRRLGDEVMRAMCIVLHGYYLNTPMHRHWAMVCWNKRENIIAFYNRKSYRMEMVEFRNADINAVVSTSAYQYEAVIHEITMQPAIATAIYCIARRRCYYAAAPRFLFAICHGRGYNAEARASNALNKRH